MVRYPCCLSVGRQMLCEDVFYFIMYKEICNSSANVLDIIRNTGYRNIGYRNIGYRNTGYIGRNRENEKRTGF